MKCPKCGSGIQRGWGYCPRCGMRLADDGMFSNSFSFDDMFKRIHSQMKEMDETFKKDFEVFDLSPMLRNRAVRGKGKGFRITIKSGTGMEPRIDVKTFGEDRDGMKEEIMEQLGMDSRESGTKPTERPRFRIPGMRKTVPVSHEKKRIKLPGITEEPRTEIRRTGTGLSVDIEMPGVKSEHDVEIRELENSVEIKATAKDKGYFKILTKPPNFRLSGKKFEKGGLHLVFS